MPSDETRYANKVFMAGALPLMKTIATIEIQRFGFLLFFSVFFLFFALIILIFPETGRNRPPFPPRGRSHSTIYSRPVRNS